NDAKYRQLSRPIFEPAIPDPGLNRYFKGHAMTTNHRSHPSTSRPDDVARIVSILERSVRPLAPAALWHTCGVSNATLAQMVEHGELEIVDRGLLRLVRREPRQ